MSYLEYCIQTDYGLDEQIDLSFRRIDETGPSIVRLVSLAEGNKYEGVAPVYFAVATAPQDPADTITSRLPEADPISPQNLMTLKLWLGRCVSHQPGHEDCPKEMPVRTKLPTRVVYVGTDDGQDPPRLYSGNGEIAGYTALSYCWGGFQTHQTEKNRIKRYMHALPVERLPNSLRDAILLTRALGIQYIWIDSLCIIQDCNEDKDREMTRMANIYKDAIFTISAAKAKSCNDGFLDVQERRTELLHDSIKLPMNCLNGVIGSVLLYPFRSQFQGVLIPIDKRAWTYQEKILSRRVISFFDDSIEWRCPSCHLSDDMLAKEESGATDPIYLGATRAIFERTGRLGRFLYSCSEKKHEFRKNPDMLPTIWWMAVREYTMGSLSNLDDRLPAIAGIVSEFHDLTGDVYVAGLWISHLIKDLQWRVYERLGEPSNNIGNRDLKYDAPTWTWASVHECIIVGPGTWGNLVSDRVEIIDCKVNLVSASAPFGSVNGGELNIRAPLKFLSNREVKEMLAVKYDDGDCEFIGSIVYDRRFERHADEVTKPGGGAAPHIESTGVWFLGLSKSKDFTYESIGLVLAKRADGLFERVGMFRIDDGEDWLEYGTAELDELRSSWGDDYVVTTVTIV
ncbi:unnamed protein product [Alternaria alternata]